MTDQLDAKPEVRLRLIVLCEHIYMSSAVLWFYICAIALTFSTVMDFVDNLEFLKMLGGVLIGLLLSVFISVLSGVVTFPFAFFLGVPVLLFHIRYQKLTIWYFMLTGILAGIPVALFWSIFEIFDFSSFAVINWCIIGLLINSNAYLRYYRRSVREETFQRIKKATS